MIKRNSLYRLVRPELVGPTASDVWCEGGMWFLVFEIKEQSDSMMVFRISTFSGEIEVERVLADRENGVAIVTDVDGTVLRSVNLDE